MTAALARRQPIGDPADGTAATATIRWRPERERIGPGPADRVGRARHLTSWPAVIAAAAAGTVVVGLSYRLSAAGVAPDLYCAVFWLGMVPATLAVAARIAAPLAAATERAWAVALLGVLTFVPKFLRNPDGPLYHDEYAHWREAVDVLSSGRLLQPNALIPIVRFFPGTSGMTAMIVRLTGLPVWWAGELLLLTTHLLALFAVFVLGRVHLRSSAAGAIAALVYALNPSEMYFDTQYAYEGVAIALFLWVLTLASLAVRAQGRQRATSTGAAVACSAACVVTHHLTTLFLVVLLAGMAVSVTVQAWWRRRRPGSTLSRRDGQGVWWAVLGATVVLSGTWLTLVARPTVDYLSPYLAGSLGQLLTLASRRSGGRVLLAPSVQPVWERALTALAPVVIGLFALTAWGLLRREHRKWRSDTLTLMAFGLVYFPSVLFLLAPAGAEGARRSWAFSYAGIAMLVGFVALRRPVPAGRWARRAGGGAHRSQRWSPVRASSVPVASILLAVIMIGNVGGGLNDPYRFPGPFRWGTDTTSAAPEARTAGEQLAAEAGPVRVVTDRYTALQLIGYGGLWIAAPSAGFPAYELVESPGGPGPALAGMLRWSHYDYLVVDTRMFRQPPFNGDNYGAGDLYTDRSVPVALLDRLDRVPWASRIISTPHLRVYRLDMGLVGAPLRIGP